MPDSSRSGTTVFSLVIGSTVLVSLIILGFVLFSAGRVTELGGKAVGSISGYEVNVRKCPSLDCESTAIYHEQQQVVITNDDVQGDESHGSRVWVEIQYGDEVRYIHKYFVSLDGHSGAGDAEYVTTVAEILFAIGMLIFISWSRLHAWAAKNERSANYALAIGILACGLAAGLVAFLVARSAGQSNATFLSAALANLGAGLVGAAVTFVFFQVVLSRRTPTRDQLSELQIQLAELTQIVDDNNRRTNPQSETMSRWPQTAFMRAWVLVAALTIAAISWTWRRRK